jgi:hypothetical protein
MAKGVSGNIIFFTLRSTWFRGEVVGKSNHAAGRLPVRGSELGPTAKETAARQAQSPQVAVVGYSATGIVSMKPPEAVGNTVGSSRLSAPVVVVREEL